MRQNEPTRAFTVFRADGAVVATGPAEPKGDWHRPMYRHPLLGLLGFQMGPEDVSRRLLPFGDSAFLHVLQENEFAPPDWSSPTEYDAIPTYVIRYGLDARMRDTLAVLPGPPTLVEEVWAGRTIIYSQPLWSGGPVLATGQDWYALGHGDSSHVVVRSSAGDTLLIVRWPDSRRAVLAEERVHAAKWSLSADFLRGIASRELANAEPHLVELEIDNRANNTMQFADTMATIAAAYGIGRCLFLSGINPRDWQDGTSLTWVVIDVADGAFTHVIRLVPPEDAVSSEFEATAERGIAVRSFDTRHAFGSYRNSDGLSLVVRYPLPVDCSGRSDQDTTALGVLPIASATRGRSGDGYAGVGPAPRFYSSLSASVGWIASARRAGTKAASRPTAAMSATTRAIYSALSPDSSSPPMALTTTTPTPSPATMPDPS